VESRCALRISSKTMSAEKIGHLVGVTPSKAYDASQPISRTNRNPRGISVVLFESGVRADASLEEHIAKVLHDFQPRTGELRSLRKECNIDLFCMYSSESGQGTCTLSSMVLRELANFDVSLIIDLYPPTSD
jgi:hypothetical protein